MSYAGRRRAQARAELWRAEAALRRASLLLDSGGAIYEGAVAARQAEQTCALATRLTGTTPGPAPAALAT